ncbi:phosphotransferase [Aliikangiella sp. G2MR2-5]|uniref:phosphotransferase n=1 Tax=Aliikangiella sp. G2MR2-5 TaxID=2788943 RepID=UPI0018A9EE57|nr:phosphotransferase [Aliikangiella sp. G2MR2-5]
METGFSSKYSPLPWWLLAGKGLQNEVLLLGVFPKKVKSFLGELAKNLVCIECLSSAHNNIIEQAFSVIIVSDSNLFESNTEAFNKLLSGDAKVILLKENSLSISKLKRMPLNWLRALFKKESDEALLSIRERYVKCYPSVAYDGIVHDSFLPGDYSSNKNIFLLKERLKIFLRNSLFYRFLHNKKILISLASKNDLDLLDEVKRTLLEKTQLGFNDTCYCSGALYKNGKIVFTYKDRLEKDNAHVLVVALSEAAVQQRDNEFSAVKTLVKESSLSRLIPGHIEKYIVCGFNCYFMKQSIGMTVDIKMPGLETVTSHCFDNLKLFNRAGLRECKQQVFVDKLDYLFNELSRRNPGFDQQISQLKRDLNIERFVKGMPSVYMHGDMKLENFIINTELEVVGIIDFELSDLTGFPLLDLIYLLLYNRQMGGQARFVEIYSLFVNEDFSQQEKIMLDDYLQAFGLNRAQLSWILIIFFVHHFAVRFQIDNSSEFERNEFKHLLSLVEQKLTALTCQVNND